MNVELMHVMGDDMSIYNTAVISKRRQSNSPTHAHDAFIKNMVTKLMTLNIYATSSFRR